MTETPTDRKPTIGNMPGADLDVQFPSGETRRVNMIVLLAETQNAEYRNTFGRALAPNAPGIKALRDKYELDAFFGGPVRTWDDTARVMRHFHDVCKQHIRNS